MITAFETDKTLDMKKRKGRPPIDSSIAPGERSKELLQGRVSKPVYKALVDFMNEYNKTHPKAEKSAFIEDAIKAYLKSKSWPVPDEPPPMAPSAERRTPK